MDFLAEGMQDTNLGLVGQANIKVIGVGGAGNNMVGWLYKKGIKGAEIIACNTDKQHLGIIDADRKFLIGKGITRGLGCGGFPEKGAESAKESMNELKESLKKKNQWIEITKKPARPKIFSDTDKSIDENSKDINIILAAMRVERDTQKLYLGIAEKLKSPDGRKFFSALSDFEQGHFELLDGILYNLTYNRVEA